MHAPAPDSADLKVAYDLPAKTRLSGATAYSSAASLALKSALTASSARTGF